ncbi:sorting nexin-5-like [Silurus asotus]|uniref:Sorting nexin-5-like n=1 Tax=Silurus asotus TaxID=30991 RepID=A0AAD5FGY7_SILAS|nr:sorting nexin-5-like [Silurus asotus]
MSSHIEFEGYGELSKGAFESDRKRETFCQELLSSSAALNFSADDEKVYFVNMDESAAKVNANSIVIADVTQDGDTLTFAVTSQKLSSRNGICVFRTYEDFEWLQQSLFSQDDVAGLYGVIFPPLPAKPLPPSAHTQTKALKQLGFLALGNNWQLYCRALEFYLQQVAAHNILGKSKLLHSFLSSTEVQRFNPNIQNLTFILYMESHTVLGRCSTRFCGDLCSFSHQGVGKGNNVGESSSKQRSKKGIFDRLSHAMEEMRKEGHKKFLDVVLTKQRLALACGHFSTSLHLCVTQDNPSAMAFSKICVKLSDIMDAVKRNLDSVSENDVCTLGLGLDFESRYQEAKKEMLFRRTCKLVELENIIKTAEKAKSNKKAIMDGVQKVTQKEFNLISSVAKEEIDWYHKTRVSVLRGFLTHWCEKQLDTAKESAALFSQLLEAWKGFPL